MPKTVQPPGPKQGLVMGNAWQFWREGAFKMFTGAFADYGDIVSMRFGPQPLYLVGNPQDAQWVLQKNYRNYVKGSGYDGLRLVLGNGLVTSEGQFWRRQRKLAQPAFTRQSIEGFAQDMIQITDESIGKWPGHIELHGEMMSITLRVVLKTLLGSILQESIEEIKRVVPICLEYADLYTRFPIRPPAWLLTPRRRRFNEAVRTLDTIIYQEIDKRRSLHRTKKRADILDMFLAAVDDESSESMNDKQVRDEVATMVGAGHETTAGQLTFVWKALTDHRDIYARVVEEVDSVLGEKPPTLQALSQLDYTDRVLKETLRLYSPVWTVERVSKQADTLSGYDIPPGAIVVVSPFGLHRNPRFWPNPEVFDPDRFLPERSEDRHRFAYAPFSGGPRICIGNDFARLEAKIVLSMIIQRYELGLAPGETLEFDSNITLRPRNGLRFVVRPRHGARPKVAANR